MPTGVRGRGQKLDKTEREKKIAEACELAAKGWNQYDIANRIGVSQPQVGQYLRKARARYIDRADAAIQERMGGALQSLEWAQKEASQAWELAKDKFLQELLEQVLQQSEEAAEKGITQGTFTIRVKSMPDSAYLNTFRQLIKDQCGILGIQTTAEGNGGGANVDVNVGVQVNIWDQLAQVSQGVLVDRVEARIEEALKDPTKPVIGLKELPQEPPVTLDG